MLTHEKIALKSASELIGAYDGSKISTTEGDRDREMAKVTSVNFWTMTFPVPSSRTGNSGDCYTIY